MKRLREGHGWTLDAMAERSTSSKGALSEIENGIREPHLVTLRRIANALGVPVSTLLGEASEPDHA